MKENNKLNKKVIIGVILILLIVSGYFVVKNLMDINDNYDVRMSTVTETRTIVFSNYEMQIPTDILSVSGDNDLKLSKDDANWQVAATLMNENFDELKEKKSSLKEKFSINGYESSIPKIVKYNNTEFIVQEVEHNDLNILIAYTKINSNTTVSFAIIDGISKEFNYGFLNDLSNIVKSVKKK